MFCLHGCHWFQCGINIFQQCFLTLNMFCNYFYSNKINSSGNILARRPISKFKHTKNLNSKYILQTTQKIVISDSLMLFKILLHNSHVKQCCVINFWNSKFQCFCKFFYLITHLLSFKIWPTLLIPKACIYG